MLAKIKLLAATLLLMSIQTFAQIPTSDALGELPIDEIPKDLVLTPEHFPRVNKIVPMKTIIQACDQIHKESQFESYEERMRGFLGDAGMSLDEFMALHFVNFECMNGNLAYEVMENNGNLFNKFIRIGFNFNRPFVNLRIQRAGVDTGRVGTMLDFAYDNFSLSTTAKDKGYWMSRIQALKENNFKTCSGLGFKCGEWQVLEKQAEERRAERERNEKK